MTGMKDNVDTPKRGRVDGPGSYAGFLIPAAMTAGRFLLRPFGQFVAPDSLQDLYIRSRHF